MQQLLTQIKEDVINKITVLSAILFVLPYMLSLSRWFDMGWKNIYIFHTIVYLALLGLAFYRKRFNYFQKTIAVTILYLLISFVGLYKFGLNGGYYFAIVAMAIISSLTKRSFAIYASLVILSVFSLIAIGYSTYSIDPAVDLNVLVRSPFHWLLTIVSIFSVILIFIYGFGDFYRNLTETIVENEKVNSNLLLVKSIIDKSPSLIYSADIDGRIIMANKEFQDLFSLQESEIIGKLRQEFMPLEVAKQHRENDLEVVRTKKAIVIEEENMEADGKHYYISQKFPLFDSNGAIQSVVGISTDVTEHIKTKEALFESENKYKSLFENSGDGIIVFNEQSEILELNNKICKILGYDHNELKVLKGYEFIHSEDLANKDHAAALKKLQQGTTLYTQYRLRRKDGSYIHTELSTKMIGEGQFLNIIRDISERKLAEKALEESEIKYRSFFENSMDAILLTQTDGIILSANPAACEMFGCTEDEIIELGRKGLTDSTDPRLSTLISTRTEKGKVRGEITMLRKDGSSFEADISAKIFKNTDNKEFTSMVIRDVTDRKNAVKLLLENERKLSKIFNNHSDSQLLINLDYENEYRIDSINEPFIRTTANLGVKLDKDKIKNKPLKNLFETIGLDASYYAGTIATYQEVIKTGKAVSFTENLDVCGNNYASEVTLSPILNEFGVCQYILYNSHNITEQTRVTNALKESEQKFKLIFLTSPDFVTITLLETGTYVDVNDNYLNITGYTRAEIIGKTAEELNILIDEEDKIRLFSQLNEFGSVENLEVKLTLSNGKIIHGLISAFILLLNNKPHLFAITRDISERKLAEKTLHERENMLSVIFNHHHDLQLLVSYDSSDEFIVSTINKPYVDTLALYGIPLNLDEVIGRPLKVLNDVINLGEEFYTSTIAKYKEVADTGIPLMYTETILVAGKLYTSEITIRSIKNDEGACQYILYNSHNITEQTNANIALKESEEKFKQIFLTSPDFVTISNIEDKTYIDVNENFLAKSGYTREEIIGKTSIEINIWHNPEDRVRMISILEQKGYVENMEAKFTLKNGTIIDGLLSAALFKIDNKDHILTITRDISELKQTEKAFKESASNLSSMIDNREDFIYSIDLNFNYIIFNSAFKKSIKQLYNIDLKKGMSSIADLTEEEAKYWIPKFESAFKGEINSFEFELLVDGKIKYYQTTLNPIIEDGKVTGASGISKDITEQKLLNRALQLSEEKFEKSFRLSPFLITLSTFEGKIVDVNDCVYETLGYTRDEFLARKVNDNPLWVNVEDRENFINLLKRGEYVSSKEVLFYKKSGEIRVFSWSGCVIELEGVKTCLTIVYDITERKQAEMALVNEKNLLSAIIENIPVMLTRYDPGTNILYLNKEFEEKVGWKTEDLETINLIEKVYPDPKYREEVLGYMQEASADWKEFVLSSKTGALIDSEWCNLRLADGTQIGIGIDITEKKKNKAEIINLNKDLEIKVSKRTAELESINKELSTFTYSVSHDLKAPLRGIDGYSKLLEDIYKSNLNQEAKSFIEKIRSSTFQMNQIIDDLLEYSRLEKSQLNIGKIKVKSIINSVLSLHPDETEAGYFILNKNIEGVEIVADSKGLLVALRNIIENAIKFTIGKDKPTIFIALEESEHSWIISVKDNGIGFDMKYHDKIFDIFQRLQRVEDFPGTGIGLALVSKAMQRMNGKTWAESTPNIGSTFYLEIPKN